jgi:hypothetical protein
VVCDDDGHEEAFTDVLVVEQACQRIEDLGLTLADANQTLTALQQRLVEHRPRPLLQPAPSVNTLGSLSGSKGTTRALSARCLAS